MSNTKNSLEKESTLHLDKEYLDFFKEIKTKLQYAQIKAALAANTEQIRFYWELGSNIAKQQV
jgi:hypothetical protein